MPELPEVETMVSRLQKYVGMNVVSIKPSVGEDPERYNENNFLPRQRLNGVFRRGKFMVFMLDDCALIAHNAMSGYWDEADEPWTFDYVEGKRSSTESDVRATIEFETSEGTSRVVRFHDARKFGYLHKISPADLSEKLGALGPDAIETTHLYEPSSVVDDDQFVEIFSKMKTPIKAAIMDQRKLAGVGNIYAAEACWLASINPNRPANTISEIDLIKLNLAIEHVLESALERNLNYDSLNVYGKTNCPSCNTALIVEDIKGRSTHWCKSCQA